MKQFWLRLLAALTCTALLITNAPVFAQDGSGEAVLITEIVQELAEPAPEAEAAPDGEAEAAAQETEVLAAAETAPVTAAEDPAESTTEQEPVSTEEPAMESAATEAPLPTEEILPTEEAAPAETPAPDASAAPEAQTPAPEQEGTPAPEQEGTPAPEQESADEAAVESETAPTLEGVVAAWTAELDACGYSKDYSRALWIYTRFVTKLRADNSADAQESAEAALLEGRAGSLGFALAMQLLLDAADIENVIIHAENDPAEAWIAAKLDGEWTHIDAFADARSGEFGAHFGLTDAAMARSREWDAAGLPACTDPANNYFVREEGYFPCADEITLRALLSDAQAGGADAVCIYRAGDVGAEDARAILDELAPGALLTAEENDAVAVFEIAWPADANGEADMDEPGADEAKIEDTDAADESGAEEALPMKSSAARPAALPLAELEMGVDERYSLADWAILPEGSDEELKYSSSKTKYATVSKKGVITAIRAGSAVIRIESESGFVWDIDLTIKSAPRKMSFTADRILLAVGETLETNISFNSGAGGSVSYRSEDESVATVDESGVITAQGPGEVRIVAESYNGIEKSGEITVVPAPVVLSLSENSINIGAQDSWRLDYSLDNGNVGDARFFSLDESIVTVDEGGVISALREGSTSVGVETYNGVRAYCSVNVLPAPEGIELSAPADTIGVGEDMQLQARILPEGTRGTVKYSSSASKYVTVDDEGVVTGKRAGSATITAETYNGKTASIKVSVKSAPRSVSFAADRVVVGVGETVQLSAELNSGAAGSFRFVSDDEEKLTIDENGLCSTHAAGEVQVSVVTYNGKKKSGTITILEAPEEIILPAGTISIGAEDSWVLDYALNEGAGGSVSFRSSNTSVATIDENGEIRALKEGSTFITVLAYNGVRANCIVNVIAAPEAVTLSAERSEIGYGEKMQLDAQILPGGTFGTLEYSSSNSKYVSVDDEGVVTGKRVGSATITAETYNGKTASIKITVKSAPSRVSLSTDRAVLGLGESARLSAELNSGAAGAYRFISEDEEKLTIDEDGVATAHALGEAEVSVVTYNGKRKSGVITILPGPETITPADDSVSIAIGDSWVLDYSLNEGSAGGVKYSSSDPQTASVDENGEIRALNRGNAIIYIEAYNGVRAQCVVSVVPAPTELILEASRTEIGLGEELQLTTRTLPDGAVGEMRYKSSASKYISVDDEGVVTAKRVGSAIIGVESFNGLTATIKLTVKKAPGSVSLSTDRTELGLGETAQLTATLPSGTAGGYRFTSEDEEMLTIDENGLATAHAVGEARVSVVTYNGKKKSGVISIKKAPEFMLISPAVMEIGMGDSMQLKAQLSEGSAGTISYASEDPDIVSIDPETGMMQGLAVGRARVVAIAYNGVYAAAYVDVLPQPTYIRLPFETLVIGLDDEVQLLPEVDPGTSSSFSYASESTRIAKVDENGVVTGVRVGKTRMKIASSNGLELVFGVEVREAPKGIRFEPDAYTLGVGEILQLEPVLPEGSAGSVSYEAFDSEIAAVDESGRVTALKEGETVIRGTTYNGKKDNVQINVVPAPKDMELDTPGKLGVGQQYQIAPVLYPEGSHSSFSYELIDGDCVSIDDDGMLTALAEGKATVRVSTHVKGLYADFRISVLPAPETLSFAKDSYEVYIEDTLQLKPILTPSDCVAELRYVMDRAGFFTIDEEGLVQPLLRGSTTVTVYTHNGLSTQITISVIDPYFPEKIRFASDPPAYLEVGDGFTPIVEVYPETGVADMEWSSSDEDVATVNARTGKVIAQSHGATTIEGVSRRNPALTLSYKLVVLSPERCLTMPTRRTSTSKINTTLSQIKNVRSSAYRELEAAYTRGEIDKSEYNTRYAIVSRAFDMHLFPWMTKEEEPYWKAANSENGAKDYKPDTVYYGLPYTQTVRRYNVSSAVSAGYYYDSGKGYYLMNNDKFKDRMYAGNDCSSYASMSVWGTGKSHSYDSTRVIATTNVYDTMDDWTQLRTGDLLNKYDNHVVIFLYYANAAKTQMVIIEQGGGEAGTNTISCSIRKTSYYKDRGYSIKRLASLN